MKNKKIFYGILVIAVLVVAGIGLLIQQNKFITTEEITNFEECANAGYLILESYPRQCKAPDGKTFVEEFCADLCGDGICQEVVCMAIGCPCPETLETCPEDCKHLLNKSKFCPDYGDCNDYGLESRKCDKIGDCIASCSYGCVSKKWMESRMDCQAMWENFECECMNNICQRKT